MLDSTSYQATPQSALHNPFLEDVLEGLSKPQKSISAKYFYDTAGSQYFDQICHLPEYYPYRSELKLLPKVVDELSRLTPEQISIIEFGAGALKKIRFLLEGLAGIKEFIPIDIAAQFLQNQCSDLQRDYPELKLRPVAGDFCQPLHLPEKPRHCTLGFFPGSTIGNFSPQLARTFLQNAKKTLGKNSFFLVGVDTKKDAETLHNAYNDSQGVTAKFNLNLLSRMNRELSANFDLNRFEHYAFYNVVEGRVEMHLISQEEQVVSVGGHHVPFRKGESIHTESSYKYTPPEFNALASSAGWRPQTVWMADNDAFSMHLLATSPDSIQ